MTDHEEKLDDITPEELAAAEALRRDLEAKDPPAGSDAAFARGLRATARGAAPIEEGAAQRAIERALDAHARARRRRIWGPVLIAAAVLLAAVPGLRAWTESTRAPAPVPADALFAGPFVDASPASERTAVIARARRHAYFEARIAEGGGR